MGESRELRCPAQLDSHHVSQERLDASDACSNGELPKSSAAGVQRMKKQMRCRRISRTGVYRPYGVCVTPGHCCWRCLSLEDLQSITGRYPVLHKRLLHTSSTTALIPKGSLQSQAPHFIKRWWACNAGKCLVHLVCSQWCCMYFAGVWQARQSSHK